jgi:cell division protein FtsN
MSFEDSRSIPGADAKIGSNEEVINTIGAVIDSNWGVESQKTPKEIKARIEIMQQQADMLMQDNKQKEAQAYLQEIERLESLPQ